MHSPGPKSEFVWNPLEETLPIKEKEKKLLYIIHCFSVKQDHTDGIVKLQLSWLCFHPVTTITTNIDDDFNNDNPHQNQNMKESQLSGVWQLS